MTTRLTVQKIGNDLGLILPKEMLNQLQVEEGQLLLLTKTTSAYKLSSDNNQGSEHMAVFQDLAKRYHNALTELAKH